MAADFGILFGWKGAVRGREKAANESFGQFVGYLTGLQKEHRIESFEPVILTPNSGDVGGFFLIRGEYEKLLEVRRSDAWREWQTRAITVLEGFTVLEAYLGKKLEEQMALYGKVVAAL